MIHQPHDKFFKLTMSNVAVAKDFFQSRLPAPLLELVDLSTLALQKETFVEDDFKSIEADVVYSAQFGEQPGYFYVLSEQQSAVDHWISFRLLRYMLSIMAKHHKQHPKNCLPIVYPIVVYSGRPIWQAPLDIFELFGEHKTMAREILMQPYQLIDLHRLTNESLRQHLLSGVVEFSLRNRKARDAAAFYDKLLPWLDEISMHFLDKAGNLMSIVLKYALAEIESEEVDTFLAKSKQYLSKSLRGEAMTLAEVFRSEGRDEIKQAIALKMLAESADICAVAEMTSLPVAAVRALAEGV
jgi:predicted transposase/invertase (TIGR01784 family)